MCIGKCLIFLGKPSFNFPQLLFYAFLGLFRANHFEGLNDLVKRRKHIEINNLLLLKSLLNQLEIL